MDEKKVATKQERLMFEQLIQNDRQYPNRRQNQMGRGSEMMPTNTPQVQRNNLEQPQLQPNETYQPQQGNASKIQQRPLIKRNIGKRDGVWEEKRKRKMEMIEYLNQREQHQYDDRQYPRDQYMNEYKKNTPSEPQGPLSNKRIEQNETPMKKQQQRMTPISQEYNQQLKIIPMNNNESNLQRKTPILNSGQQAERTPLNIQQNRTPINSMYPQGNNNEIQRKTPLQNQDIRSSMNQDNSLQQQRTPLNHDYYEQHNSSPMQNYNQTMANQQIRSTPLTNNSDTRQNNLHNTMDQTNNNNRTPLNINQDINQRDYQNHNNALRKTPQYGYNLTPNNQPNRTPYNVQQNGTPFNQPQQNRTPYNQPQPGNFPYDQPQLNRTLYNQPQQNRTPFNQLQQAYQQPQYDEQENYNRNNQQYSKTPQQYGVNESNYQRTPQYQHDQIAQQQMRYSRTPFTDSQGNPSYKPSGSFYAQNNNPNTIQIPNRLPSRPFDNLSFKDQRNGNQRGSNQNYYPNSQQPYY